MSRVDRNNCSGCRTSIADRNISGTSSEESMIITCRDIFPPGGLGYSRISLDQLSSERPKRATSRSQLTRNNTALSILHCPSSSKPLLAVPCPVTSNLLESSHGGPWFMQPFPVQRDVLTSPFLGLSRCWGSKGRKRSADNCGSSS
jgi:hypothetical protein